VQKRQRLLSVPSCLPAHKVFQHQLAGHSSPGGVPQASSQLRNPSMHHKEGVLKLIRHHVVRHTQGGHLTVDDFLHTNTEASGRGVLMRLDRLLHVFHFASHIRHAVRVQGGQWRWSTGTDQAAPTPLQKAPVSPIFGSLLMNTIYTTNSRACTCVAACWAACASASASAASLTPAAPPTVEGALGCCALLSFCRAASWRASRSPIHVL